MVSLNQIVVLVNCKDPKSLLGHYERYELVCYKRYELFCMNPMYDCVYYKCIATILSTCVCTYAYIDHMDKITSVTH